MNDIMKEINTAYGLLASIPVRGDAVDAAAACRMALRKAYKLAEARSAREQEDAGGHAGRPDAEPQSHGSRRADVGIGPYGSGETGHGAETERSGVCEDGAPDEAQQEARSAREQGNSELRRPENRPGEAWRHFRRSSEQLPVAEGAERDKSGFGGERRSKGAERCLPAGQEEQSGVCEDESGEDEA